MRESGHCGVGTPSKHYCTLSVGAAVRDALAHGLQETGSLSSLISGDPAHVLMADERSSPKIEVAHGVEQPNDCLEWCRGTILPGVNESPPSARAPAPYRGKRAFDLLLVVASAPLWLVALGCVGLLVRARLGSPVLFQQKRPGMDGRVFTLLKFRTMSSAIGADGQLLPDAERLGSFGRWLRSTSLDELPELLNVLRGDMSLVGPRPLLVRYLPLYSVEHRLRHAVPPGLTGLAQVSGRNALTWPERFDLDVDYARSNSLALDVSILWRTIVTVLRREGIAADTQATMTAFSGYGSEVPAERDARRR